MIALPVVASRSGSDPDGRCSSVGFRVSQVHSGFSALVVDAACASRDGREARDVGNVPEGGALEKSSAAYLASKPLLCGPPLLPRQLYGLKASCRPFSLNCAWVIGRLAGLSERKSKQTGNIDLATLQVTFDCLWSSSLTSSAIKGFVEFSNPNLQGRKTC